MKTVRRLIGSVALAGVLSVFGGAALTVTASPASAQLAPPVFTDFCDSNGVCDISGYAAAYAAYLNRLNGGGGTGGLPVTGSDPGLLIGIGASLVLVGGGLVYGARRRTTDVVELEASER